MITAQDLYDRREQLGEIDGNDLHDLFVAVCDGDPSPVGRIPIDAAALVAYAADCRTLAAQHGTRIPEIVAFCEAFLV